MKPRFGLRTALLLTFIAAIAIAGLRPLRPRISVSLLSVSASTDPTDSYQSVTVSVRNEGHSSLWVSNYLGGLTSQGRAFDPLLVDETEFRLDIYENEHARLDPGQMRSYFVHVPVGFKRIRVFIGARDWRGRSAMSEGEVIEIPHGFQDGG